MISIIDDVNTVEEKYDFNRHRRGTEQTSAATY